MFNKFSKIIYPIYDQNDNLIYQKEVVDITRAFIIASNKFSDTNTAYKFQYYELDEYDTPMSLASKIYSNPNYHWVLMVINNVINPYTDWYMDSITLRNFVIKKYKVSTPAFDDFKVLSFNGEVNSNIISSLIKEYGDLYTLTLEYKSIIERFNEFVMLTEASSLDRVHHYFNSSNNQIVNDYYFDLYQSGTVNIPEFIIPVTNYEFEFNENQKRKIIKILDQTQLSSFIADIESIIG